ncbi:hypothetical protein GNP44_11900 [Aliivibrio fischeri]|uniref:hypothetical protein n=1 Tax=Aliivibrio fischeri TaxID=668 RepID=UPI0012D9B85D|nr:hypothetical protein [Aliivibrio fischeri]MUK30775.1 hypothetical protein [Aliivibrio fischeri]
MKKNLLLITYLLILSTFKVNAESKIPDDALKGSLFKAAARCFVIDSRYAKYNQSKPYSAALYSSEIDTEMKAISFAIKASNKSVDLLTKYVKKRNIKI